MFGFDSLFIFRSASSLYFVTVLGTAIRRTLVPLPCRAARFWRLLRGRGAAALRLTRLNGMWTFLMSAGAFFSLDPAVAVRF